MRARAQVHQMVVGRQAVHGAVLRHRRDDDAVLQRHAAQRERREHRRHAGARPGPAPCGEPVFDSRRRRPCRAGAGSRARCAASASAANRRTARARAARGARRSRTTRSSCAPRSGSSAPRRCGALRSPPARRVRSPGCAAMLAARSIASSSASLVPEPIEKCAVCAASPISTTGVPRPSAPWRCTQRLHTTRGKRIHAAEPRRWAALLIKRVAVEVLREQPLAESDALFLRHLFQPGGAPHRFGRFDDEGRGVRVEAVGVRLEPAPFGVLDRERERVEQLVRAEPDEAALAQVDVGLVGGGVLVADAAVQAVGGDDQVGVESARRRRSRSRSASARRVRRSGPAGC